MSYANAAGSNAPADAPTGPAHHYTSMGPPPPYSRTQQHFNNFPTAPPGDNQSQGTYLASGGHHPPGDYSRRGSYRSDDGNQSLSGHQSDGRRGSSDRQSFRSRSSSRGFRGPRGFSNQSRSRRGSSQQQQDGLHGVSRRRLEAACTTNTLAIPENAYSVLTGKHLLANYFKIRLGKYEELYSYNFLFKELSKREDGKIQALEVDLPRPKRNRLI